MPPSDNRQGKPSAAILADLGLLGDLLGSWEGHGFNLIARPNFENGQNLFLQLSETHEMLQVQAIGASIPNRGFGQSDIELFGVTYLQKISDATTGGALHIEPGTWVTQPGTTYPAQSAPPSSQIVARMGSIPHGNAILAQGTAAPFTGSPTLGGGVSEYAFSSFPSFNSTPFPVPAAQPPAMNAAGSSEKATALAAGVAPPVPGVSPGFQEYDLATPASATNPRTDPLPPVVSSLPPTGQQAVVNDPIALLQAVVEAQVNDGHTFEGVVLNVASQSSITFLDTANSPANPATPGSGPSTAVQVSDGAGGIESIVFLEGGEPVGVKGPNAATALVYATFWIEKVSHRDRASFMQLQYAQMVVLNFAILKALPGVALLGWPHVTVGTLKKPFHAG